MYMSAVEQHSSPEDADNALLCAEAVHEQDWHWQCESFGSRKQKHQHPLCTFKGLQLQKPG